MTPRLFSVWFRSSSAQYPRLARVLEMTARRHCPTWEIDIRQVDPPTCRAASGSASDAANHHKLEVWTKYVETAPDGARILLVDADTFITGPLDPLWNIPFDVAYTARPTERFPLNAGVIAVRASWRARRFMGAWQAIDETFLRNVEARVPWRQNYGGQNQASLGALLRGSAAMASVVRMVSEIAPLPCSVWNCEDTTWAAFDPAVTRIVHVKSALRMAAFGTYSHHKLRPLVSLWRALDREAQAQDAQARGSRSC